MGLKGDLLSADLSNVFQMLAMNRKSGRLLVQDQGDLLNRRELYIEEDRVALVEPPKDRPAEALLLQAGLLGYEALSEARERSARYPITTMAALQQGDHIREGALDEVARLREEEDILEIFLWRNVRFSLDETGKAPDGRPYFNLDQIVMEAARRQDEWLHATSSGEGRYAIYERTEATPTPGELEPVHHMVLDEIDGISDRRDITARTGFSRYFVDVALHTLATGGFARQLPMNDLIQGGDALLAANRTGDALRLFRAALRHDRRNLTIHRRLAEALETVLPAKASAHLRFCAAEHVELGETREALDLLKAARSLVPTDLRPVQQGLALLHMDPEAFIRSDSELLDAGRRLLTLKRDVLDPEQCLPLARLLAAVGSEDQELLESHARLSLRAGRKEEAATSYRRLAELRVARGDLRGALDILRNLGSLDPRQRSVYDQQIHRLLGRLQKTSGLKQRVRFAVMGLVLVAALFGAFFLYEKVGASRLDDAPRSTPTNVAEAEAQLQRFEQIARYFRFTTAGHKARQLADERRANIQLMLAETKQRRDDTIEGKKRAIDDAIALIDAGEQSLKDGDFEGALAHFAKARDDSRSNVFPAWISARAAKSYDDVASYMTEAKKLTERAQAFLSTGDHDAAFKATIEAFERYPLTKSILKNQIPLLFDPLPGNAEVTINGTRHQGVYMAPLTGELNVEVAAEGFDGLRLTIQLPTESPHLPLVLSPKSSIVLEPSERTSSLIGLNGRLMIVGRSGQVTFADPATGALHPAPRPAGLVSLSLPALRTASGVVSLSDDGEVRLLDEESGVPRWKVSALPTQVGDLLGPVTASGHVVFADRGGRLAAVSLEGRNRNVTRRIAAGIRALFPLTDGRVVVHSADGSIEILTPGRLERERVIPGKFAEGVIVFDDHNLAIAGPDGISFVPLDEHGKSRSFSRARPRGPLLRVAGRIVWRESQSVMTFDGTTQRTVTLSSSVERIEAIDNETIAVKTSAGEILAVRANDLAPLASLTTTKPVVSIAIANHRLCVAFADGKITTVPLLR